MVNMGFINIIGRSSLPPLLGAISLFGFLLLSLYWLSHSLENPSRFEEHSLLLLSFNIFSIAVLLFIIVLNIFRLIKQYLKKTPGIFLTIRLVIIFVILTTTPVFIIYNFSARFLEKGLASWFNVGIEEVLDTAITLGQSALDVRKRFALQETEKIAQALLEVEKDQFSIALYNFRIENIALVELTLFGKNNKIIASSSDTIAILPNLPNDEMLTQLHHTNTYVALESSQQGFYIRSMVVLKHKDVTTEKRFLQALFIMPKRENELINKLEQAYDRYNKLVFLQQPLLQSFLIALSLALFLTLLVSAWLAFFVARRLVAPLKKLADATKAVSEGIYTTQIHSTGNYDLDFLVTSFNQMTRKLEIARAQAKKSQSALQQQHAYLETVLERISSGVITLTSDLTLHTTNNKAELILGIDLIHLNEKNCLEIAEQFPNIKEFCQKNINAVYMGYTQWELEVEILAPDGRKVLMCRGSLLPEQKKEYGYVLVFDDVTKIIQAERQAVWNEAAKRLAHEIKNPLTPIQLSAERLRHKYLEILPVTQTTILNRATQTIIDQVKALQSLVNAFGEYARTPQIVWSQFNINNLIQNVVELYQDNQKNVKIKLHLEKNLPTITADQDRLRQVLHNIIKNALEAVEKQEVGVIILTTELISLTQKGLWLELKIEDNGSGIEEKLLNQIFQPYLTHKPKGTGLGLAIVRRIIEEHHGKIWAENSNEGGLIIIIHLPLQPT